MHPNFVLLKVNDRFAQHKDGWADCALYITSEDPQHKGVVREIQIVHSKLLTIREDFGAHDIYAEGRFASACWAEGSSPSSIYENKPELHSLSLGFPLQHTVGALNSVMVKQQLADNIFPFSRADYRVVFIKLKFA